MYDASMIMGPPLAVQTENDNAVDKDNIDDKLYENDDIDDKIDDNDNR